uniref:Amino acid permease 2 n=1 Tax=Cajanus cajan TaxID=3821 RepID=A0A151R7C4_CAJCA|nr:Amino acid permease 2 [Cajanus cajan]
MAEKAGTSRNVQLQAFDMECDIDVPSNSRSNSECYDEDGRLKRTGNVWTASSHIITAVIGSGVLSLAWAIAQLGWIAGPAVMFLFSLVTFYTSSLLAQCYRTGETNSGKRNYTYMDAVRSILGGANVTFCGIFQYLNLLGIVIGYTIAASISMMAIKRSNCFHQSGGKNPCHMSSNKYMIIFGICEIFLSQIPDFDQIWWLSTVAAIMSFTYSTIGLSLGIAKVAEIKLNIQSLSRTNEKRTEIFHELTKDFVVTASNKIVEQAQPNSADDKQFKMYKMQKLVRRSMYKLQLLVSIHGICIQDIIVL